MGREETSRLRSASGLGFAAVVCPGSRRGKWPEPETFDETTLRFLLAGFARPRLFSGLLEHWGTCFAGLQLAAFSALLKSAVCTLQALCH